MTDLSWGMGMAHAWTNNVAPSRPTVGELAVFTRYLRKVQAGLNRPVDILILGSTPEFRDWAHEEALDITVVDYSLEYHDAISREIRHKNMQYRLDIGRWEDMEYCDEFDLIAGDLTIGNIDGSRLEDFLVRLSRALRVGGYIVGKNVFRDAELPRDPHTLLRDYYASYPYHPYSALVHELTMSVLPEDADVLEFSRLFILLEELRREGVLGEREYEAFQKIGIGSHFDFKFFVPSVERYESAVDNAGLSVDAIEHTDDVFTKFFPLYILKKESVS